MSDKPELLQVVLKRYEFEHDRKEKINARIPHLTTLFIAVCGIGAFIVQKAQAITSCELAAVVWVVWLLLMTVFGIATYHTFIVLRGYRYSYLPPPSDIEEHMLKCEAATSGAEYEGYRDEYYTSELNKILIKYAKSSANNNITLNADRSLSLSKAITYYSVVGVMAIVLVVVILMLTPPKGESQQHEQIACCAFSKKIVYSVDTLHFPIKLDTIKLEQIKPKEQK